MKDCKSMTARSNGETSFAQEKVPIEKKLNLTIKEAAEYSNIGQNKIESLLKERDCPFVLFVGTKKLVKRQIFEEYILKKRGV